jgi:hypothetical protein
VEYGTTTGYGSLSALGTSLVTSHSVSLTGLTPGTTYNYAVLSTDAAGTATSANFTFSTPLIPLTGGIAQVGGAGNNTGSASAPTSLSIAYSSSNGTTVVAVCALANTASAIGSISDSGSTWTLRAYVNNGTAVRSEIWSTGAGGSVASTSFTISFPGGSPASCALEEYSGVVSIGTTTTNDGNSTTMSVGLTTQDANDYVVAGLGANSFNGYSVLSGTVRQAGGLGGNAGSGYVEMDLCDNTATTVSSVTCMAALGSAPWAVPGLELRPAASAPVISAVTSSGIMATSATITWTTDQPSSSQVEYGTTTSYGTLSALSSALVTSHSVTLTGLTAGTSYNFAVLSTDAAGTATSANFTFSATASVPLISAVTASAITTASATITWTTDQPSSSQAEYGTTTGYGSLSAVGSALVTAHTVTLSGLTPGTTYYYAVLSTDAAGAATSANFTFSTTESVPVISAVTASAITTTSATITWTTDQPSSSQVGYGTTTGYGSLSAVGSALVTSHSVTLTGLTPGTTYDYDVLSTDSAGTATSANFTFVTSTPVPTISAVASSGITATSATITWTTDQPSSSQVEYGTTTGYGALSALGSALVTSHSVTLTGLTPGTTYDYAVLSTDSAGTATSANFIFATSTPVPTISAVASSGITANSATIAWTTDQPSSSQVKYGTTTSYGSLSSLGSSPVTSHLVTLTGLTAGTTYNYAVLSADSAGTATSANFTFSTSAIAQTGPISAVGGAHNNSGSSGVPTSLSIAYSSHSGNTIVVVCALGNTASSISSISDSGSAWALRAYVNNGTAVRSEIWSTSAGGAVASTSFTINLSAGSPASCALEEYSGVLSLGTSATNEGTSATISVSMAAQDANDYIAAGLGANSYNGYSAVSGTLRQVGGLTANSGSNYVEMSLCDNTVATVSTVACAAALGSASWAAPALELRAVATVPVISTVASSGITSTSAVVTWTTDQPSSSQVKYGSTTSYGTVSALSSSLVTSHSVTLNGLTPGTTYNYAVLSADAAGTATSANFTFSTTLTVAISAVGGAHSNTGSNAAPTSLSIAYSSHGGNTIVAVCALGNTASSINSVTDRGSTWTRGAYVNNGTAVRSEIWATAAGGSVASTSFTINMSQGSPASCALEEYSGVAIIGSTAVTQGTSGTLSVSLPTQEANDYVVAGLGANTYFGYMITNGTLRQAGGLTSNSGNNYVEMDLCDNTAASAAPVTCSAAMGSSAWAAPALQLR